MRHNLVQIEDKKGRTFHIEVWTPGKNRIKYAFTKSINRAVHEGEWRAIDRGFIRFAGGSAWRTNVEGWNPTADLYLGPAFGTIEQSDEIGVNFRWGIRLSSYDNSFGTNDIGTGEILQPWVLGFEPGMIRWRRPSTAEMVQSNLDNQAAGRFR